MKKAIATVAFLFVVAVTSFAADEIKTLGVYQPYIEKLTNGTANVPAVKKQIINQYSNLFNRYALGTPDGVFIKDPSQQNKIVSEGQGYWQILATGLARIDTPNARKYQDDFDARREFI